MPDEARLAHLVDALASKPSYATGERKFPEAVSPDEAAAIAGALQDEFEAGTAKRAELARVQKIHIACQAGCNACCQLVIMVWRPEAEAAAAWLRRPENASALAHFRASYPRWRAAVGEAPEQLAALSAGPPAPYYEALRAQHRRTIPCAFDQDGRCTIYPARPIGCRNAHALDTAERCRGDWEGAPPAAVSLEPLSQYLVSATRLLRAAHNAAGAARHHQEPLCEAVHRLLEEPA
jgi:hypothetical protein